MDRNEKGQLTTTVVLGRKFCKECGRWKLLIYFPPRRHKNGREYPKSYCDGCLNRKAKQDRASLTGKRLLERQEYDRIYYEAVRRPKLGRMGQPKLRTSAPMVNETIKPLQPLLAWISDYRPDLSATELSEITGVDWHIFSGNKPGAYFSTIDQVCVALGRPDLVAVLWPD